MSEEVNWQQLAEGFRLERNIMQEMAMKAREAGRRDGLEEAARLCQRAAGVNRGFFGRGFAAEIRALIDSPKAEGERTK